MLEESDVGTFHKTSREKVGQCFSSPRSALVRPVFMFFQSNYLADASIFTEIKEHADNVFHLRFSTLYYRNQYLFTGQCDHQ